MGAIRGILSVAAISLLTSGCFSMYSMNYINKNELVDGRWTKIVESGLGLDATHEMWFNTVHVQGGSREFKSTDERVTWYGKFKGSAFLSPFQAVFEAKWYAPDGSLFYDDTFTLDEQGWDRKFAKTYLPLAESPAREMPGRWRVEIFFRDYIVDIHEFQIVKEPTEAGGIPIHPDVALVDPLLDEDLAKARELFEMGLHVEARSYLRKVLDREPDQIDARVALTGVYVKQEKWDEALREIDLLIEHPNYEAKGQELRKWILEQQVKQE
jgi:tetratricopeptide (TPR) repeat protein